MLDSEARSTAHKALLQAKERLLRQKRVEGQLAQVERNLQEHYDRIQELERTWKRESDDVKRLTGLSVVALVTSVLGTKEQRLKKERQELAAAALKLEAARDIAGALENERDELAIQLTDLKGAERDFKAAMDSKERLIREEGESGRVLADLAEEEGKNRERARETREAINAGTEAESSLASAVESLKSASNWGTWDLLGGGFITTAIKHSRLDDAKASATRAQSALHHFKRELSDVGENLVETIDLGGFSAFADYFFDGLIVDWIVQSKISAALSRAEDVHRKVETVVFKLRGDEEEARVREATLRAEREALIERA